MHPSDDPNKLLAQIDVHRAFTRCGWPGRADGMLLKRGFTIATYGPVRFRTYFEGVKTFPGMTVLAENAQDGVPFEVKSALPQVKR